jgi:hypothetical protein
MADKKRFSIESMSDFRLRRVVCEARYDQAYLLFDRTGAIFHALKEDLKELKLLNATPTASTFESKEGNIAVEIAQTRLVGDRVTNLEVFGESCRKLFHVVTSYLEIKSFTRVGLRLLYFQRRAYRFARTGGCRSTQTTQASFRGATFPR